MRIDALKKHFGSPPVGRELDGIRQKIPDYLLQAIRVSRDDFSLDIEREPDIDPLGFRRRVKYLRGVLDHASQFDGSNIEAEFAADDPGGIEQILYQFRLSSGATLDYLYGMRECGLIDSRRPENARPTQHSIERRAKFVRDDGDEFVFGPVGGLSFFTRPLFLDQQFLSFGFNPLALGDVYA
jgi:hypothetical protein